LKPHGDHEDYLRPKHEELQLLDGCLDEPFAPPTPKSIDEVIAVKFKLTAAIGAQHDPRGGTTTEAPSAIVARTVSPISHQGTE
jgi:hypothetical protein